MRVNLRQNFAGAALEKLLRQTLADLLSAAHRARPCPAHHASPVRRRDQGNQSQGIALDGSVGGNRHLATATEPSEKGTLGERCQTRREVIEASNELPCARVLLADFDGQRTLANCRDHALGGKELGDARLKPQPLQSRRGQHDGLELSFIQFPQARVEIATQGPNFQVRAKKAQLACPPKAAGADPAARQILQRGAGTRNPRIAWIFALTHGGDHEPGGQFGGHIFHTVYSQVHAMGEEGLFNFLGEERFAAAHLTKRNVGDFVTRRLDHRDAGRDAVLLFEPRPGPTGLPEGESTAAGADHKSIGRQSVNPSG